MIRSCTLFLFSILFLCSCTNSTTENSGSVSESPSGKTPHDFMFMQRAYPSGEIKRDAYRNAVRWKKEQQQRNAVNQVWEFAGPVNIGGRITDIEIPSGEAQTYYVGAASGGIFKTTNAGATWNPIFDDQEMLSIGDIEISENDNNIVWVGTGEVNAGGGSLAYDGDGIYKSEDGGLTWQTKGLPDVGSIGKILIDPNDDDVIFVGAMGPLFRDDNNRGVYRSVDGGDTWQQVLFVSNITGVIDMAIHPTNGDIIYAASWERVRRPNFREYGGETSRIYRSTDGGDTWTELTAGLPSVAAEKGRISIDIARSNPNVLYARYADASGSIQGVYRTANGGDSWTAVNSSQLTNVGFHWWFRGIYVDPDDENTIYNVDFVVQKSIDGGNSWSTAFPGVHVDQHALAFNASVPGEVLLGNDGGFYKSTNDGASSTKDLTLPITQFYRFHVDAQNDDKIYGGSQDNSTIRTVTGGTNDWDVINGGDGFQPLVDYTDTNVIYALSQNGALRKSTNNAASFVNATVGISGGDRKNWDTPIAMDPADPQIMYYGASRLYQSTNAAGNWTAISPDLSNGPHTGNLAFGTITSIDVSPVDSDYIYVGTDDGNVWFTNDGGGNWELISATLPDRWVTKVLASRDELNTVYVTFSGYRYGEDDGHVYKSIDAGLNWLDITANLPDIPVNDIVLDKYDNLYLATDVGVMVTKDQTISWEVLGTNLPSVVVTDMHIHEDSEYLYIGTYGRSAYKLDIFGDILNTAANQAEYEVFLYPNPASEIVNIVLPGNTGKISVTLYDAMGRILKEQNYEEVKSEYLFSLDSNAAGAYFVTIDTGNTKITKRLLVD
jgi:photosystem II stability/assembly factor-like uncharacterized protein